MRRNRSEVMVWMLAICAMSSLDLLPVWQDAPGDETPYVSALIDSAQRCKNTNEMLGNPRFERARSYMRFRNAVMDKASVGPVTMISHGEPGERLTVTVNVGRPNALVYLYQPDATGAFGGNGIHFRYRGSDERYSRLFAYTISDSKGKVTVDTVMPGTNQQSAGERRINLIAFGGPRLEATLILGDSVRASEDYVKRVNATPKWNGQRWIATANLSTPIEMLAATSLRGQH